MKPLKFILLAFAMYTLNACAQDFPATPETPKTPNVDDMHTEVTSTVSNSTSVSNSGNIYKFTSKFQSSKRKGVLEMLENELNDMQVRKKGNQYTWTKVKNGETIFECELSNTKLKMLLHKNKTSYGFASRIKSLGNELRTYISAHKSFRYTASSNSVGDAQVRVERAKEELRRSLKNLENVKRKQ